MKSSDLPIANPCHEDWAAMGGDARRRFCARCTRHVHDLSDMTEPEAVALLGGPNPLCVRYGVDRGGNIVFAAPPTRRGFLRASLMAAPLAVAAPAAASMAVGEGSGCRRPGLMARFTDWLRGWIGTDEPEAPEEPDELLTGAAAVPAPETIPEVTEAAPVHPERPVHRIMGKAARPKVGWEWMGDVAIAEGSPG